MSKILPTSSRARSSINASFLSSVLPKPKSKDEKRKDKHAEFVKKLSNDHKNFLNPPEETKNFHFNKLKFSLEKTAKEGEEKEKEKHKIEETRKLIQSITNHTKENTQIFSAPFPSSSSSSPSPPTNPFSFPNSLTEQNVETFNFVIQNETFRSNPIKTIAEFIESTANVSTDSNENKNKNRKNSVVGKGKMGGGGRALNGGRNHQNHNGSMKMRM